MSALVVALADSERTLWYVSLALGLVVALAVAGMLLLLLRYLRSIETSVRGCESTELDENRFRVPMYRTSASSASIDW